MPLISVDPVLPGRAADVAVMHAFADRARTDGGALLVTGAPGSGKSALLDAAARYGSAAGARIVRTAGGSWLGTSDYAALDRVLSPLQDRLHDQPAGIREIVLTARGVTAGPVPDRLAVCAAVLALFRSAGADRPLLVLVEDSRRLDDPTARVLAFVARRLSGSHVGIIAEAPSGVGEPGAVERCALPRHRVGPLPDDAAHRLLLSRFPSLPTRVRDRLVAEGAGNPLVLTELAIALGEERRTGREPLPAVLPLGDRLTERLRGRVAGLPAETRQVLLRAALGGGDLGLLAGSGVDVLTVLDPAERAGLVSIDRPGHQVAFTHPVLRFAVAGLATALERRRARQSLAAALTADPIRQAWHLAEATPGPDARLAARMREAAEVAIRGGDAASASDALVRSAELSPDPAVRARRLLEAAFLQADVTGDLSDAVRLLDRARAAGAEFADALPVEAVIAHVVVNGEIPTGAARRLLVAAIDAHPGRADAADPILIDALHLLMLNCWTTATAEAWEQFERVVARLRPGIPPLLEMCARSFGDATRLTPELRKQITAAGEALRDERNPIVVTRMALACVYTDQLAACLEPLARVIQAGRPGGGVAHALQATVSTCCHLWHSGQWTELVELAADGVSRTEHHGYARYQVLLNGYYPALVDAVRGDGEQARTLVAEMEAWAARREAGNAVQFAHHVRALLAIAEGDYARAYLEASAISPAGVLAPYTPNALWVLMELVEGAMRSGRGDAARDHVRAMTEAGVAQLSPRLELVAAGCQAMVSGDVAAYERALALPDTQRWPFDLARIELAYGELLRHRHEPERCRPHLIAASEIFQRLGARPWIVQAERELRATGRSTTTPVAGDAPLSAQEQRIAELAAEGLSNKQIGERLHLSHRTVSAYLYQIFPKLGIVSRGGLRDALRSVS